MPKKVVENHEDQVEKMKRKLVTPLHEPKSRADGGLMGSAMERARKRPLGS